MKSFGTTKIVFVALLLTGLPLGAQECSTLQSASADKMSSYLGSFPDRRQNAPCIAFAIGKLGEQHYQPAISLLTKYLDFRWPVGAHQKQMRPVLERDKLTIYPAADALEKIGQVSLPAVVTAMQARGTSRVGMEVAVSVWMTLHKDNAPLGVSLLRQEADNATDSFSRGQLLWASSLASNGWCAPSEQAQCNEILRTKAASK